MAPKDWTSLPMRRTVSCVALAVFFLLAWVTPANAIVDEDVVTEDSGGRPGFDVGVVGFARSEKHYRWMPGPLKRTGLFSSNWTGRSQQ
jgi:hypothetical protein